VSEVIDPGAHWEITRANNAGQKPNPHGGQLDKWYVGLKNLDGRKDCDDAYWQRKSPSEVSVGDKVYGKLEKGEFGFRFYLEKEPDGGSFEAKTGSSGKGNWQPEAERDPERAARILRQHSQGLAVQARLESGDPITISGGQLHPDLVALTDAFDQDVIQAGQAATSAQGSLPSQAGASSSSQSASPGSSSRPADDTPEFFSKLLQDAHVDVAAANELGKFIAAKFSPEQKQKAQRELGELEVQGDCVRRLTSAYEQSTSKLLPRSTDGDDIPFRRPEYREMFSERERWRF